MMMMMMMMYIIEEVRMIMMMMMMMMMMGWRWRECRHEGERRPCLSLLRWLRRRVVSLSTLIISSLPFTPLSQQSARIEGK
jgi:hypothetical protein